MKKIIYFIAIIMVCVCFSSCTEHVRAKNWGGTLTINIPAGERLVEATWKEAQLWYLTEPMDTDYVPKTRIFREESNFGVMEGKVVFVESR